jgi:putative ABC transport system permease protein
MFFISGMVMVAAAVFSLMYNADLLLKTLTFVTSGIGKLRPVLVLAVAYPMSAKFRTGLTLAMFALVIFTLMVMSIISDAFGNTLADTDSVTGHWDVEMDINPSNPIDDIESSLAGISELSPSDIDAVGGFVPFPVAARQAGAESPRWKGFSIQAADDAYLDATEYTFHIIADGYGPTEEDVWQAIRDNPNLAVIGYFAIGDSGQEDFGSDTSSFRIDDLSIEDETMSPVVVEVLETQTETRIDYTVIGVLELVADNAGSMIVHKQTVDDALPFPVPVTTYRFRTGPGVDAKETSRTLESSFLEHGAEAVTLKEVIDEQVAVNSAFNNLLTGFMGMGLIVGVAALGVISLRAVVERRQQVGMLRAIGYRQGMIQLSFLVEASFVSLLGVAIGVALGTILSFNLVDSFREQIPGLEFSMPWLQIGIIIGIAYLFAMITTYLPARQAGRIQPAEALRYE